MSSSLFPFFSSFCVIIYNARSDFLSLHKNELEILLLLLNIPFSCLIFSPRHHTGLHQNEIAKRSDDDRHTRFVNKRTAHQQAQQRRTQTGTAPGLIFHDCFLFLAKRRMTRSLGQQVHARCHSVFLLLIKLQFLLCVPHQIIPAKPINPITLRVVEGKTILIGGVARVELLEVIICLICSIYCFCWRNGSKIYFVKTVMNNFLFCF